MLCKHHIIIVTPVGSMHRMKQIRCCLLLTTCGNVPTNSMLRKNFLCWLLIGDMY